MIGCGLYTILREAELAKNTTTVVAILSSISPQENK